MGEHTTRSGSPASGWTILRSAATRPPEVSAAGLSRSCGRVSHDGNTTALPAPSWSSTASAMSSASRAVAVTTRSLRSGGWAAAIAAAIAGLTSGMAVT